jgi:MoxR-like ATPase
MATIKAATAKKEEVLDITDNVQTTDQFVFMDKTLKALEIGFDSGKNVILYGPGGHGKSELTNSFFAERGIKPFVITMGTGMTTDRLFGGLNIPVFNTTGKIEYLVENSFMNYEYVVFEELFDAPDFILEQLKDILSSGVFRNGTQHFEIKTKYIVCATNRTREEFSKNASLQALMERFPLEHNVIWDNYTDIAYMTLLESKFGEGDVDPLIPFILQKYAAKNITISPRVAVTAYQIFMSAGIDGLMYIADFNKKSDILKSAVKEFEDNAVVNEHFRKIQELYNELSENNLLDLEQIREGQASIKKLKALKNALETLKVSDSFITKLEEVKGSIAERIKTETKRIMVATSVND